MSLQYAIPQVGQEFSENELTELAKTNGYEITRTGHDAVGAALLILSEPSTPVGMSFLYVNEGSETPFKRVY